MSLNQDNTVATLTLATTGNSTDQINSDCRGVNIVVDATAGSGTSPTITLKVQGLDPASGKYYDILTSAALSVTSTTLLTVYPGVTAASNVAVSAPLPRVWRVAWTIGGSNTPKVTATIGATLVV